MDTCYVCGHGPHPNGSHTYTTEAEARAWFDAQPDASYVVNGASLDAEAGLPLGSTLADA